MARSVLLLALLEAALLCNVIGTAVEDGVHPLEGEDALQEKAMAATLLESQPRLIRHTALEKRVAAGELSPQERQILRRASMKERLETAASDVAMSGRVRAQVLAAKEVAQKGTGAQVLASKLITEDNRQIADQQAVVKARREALLRAEKHLPHLDVTLVQLGENQPEEEAQPEQDEQDEQPEQDEQEAQPAQDEQEEQPQPQEEKEAKSEEPSEQAQQEQEQQSEQSEQPEQDEQEAQPEQERPEPQKQKDETPKEPSQQAQEEEPEQEKEQPEQETEQPDKKQEEAKEAKKAQKAQPEQEAAPAQPAKKQENKLEKERKSLLQKAHKKIDAALQSKGNLVKEHLKAAHKAVKNVALMKFPALEGLVKKDARDVTLSAELVDSAQTNETKAENATANATLSLAEANKQLKILQEAYDESKEHADDAAEKSDKMGGESTKAMALAKAPNKGYVRPADAPDIEKHVKKYTKLVETSQQKAKEAHQKYLAAEANSPAHENRYKQVMVEEAKNGLSASMKKEPVHHAVPQLSPMSQVPDEPTDAAQANQQREAEAAKAEKKEADEAQAKATKREEPEPAPAKTVKSDEAKAKDGKAAKQADEKASEKPDEKEKEAAEKKEEKEEEKKGEKPEEPSEQAQEEEKAEQKESSGEKAEEKQSEKDAEEKDEKAEEPANKEKASEPEKQTKEESKEEPAPAAVVLLQEISHDTMQAASSEIASKAFNWEQNRQDAIDTQKIEKRLAEHKRQQLMHRENDHKLSRTEEITSKRAAKREHTKQLEAIHENHETWEIAAKAYKRVSVERRDSERSDESSQ